MSYQLESDPSKHNLRAKIVFDPFNTHYDVWGKDSSHIPKVMYVACDDCDYKATEWYLDPGQGSILFRTLPEEHENYVKTLQSKGKTNDSPILP